MQGKSAKRRVLGVLVAMALSAAHAATAGAVSGVTITPGGAITASGTMRVEENHTLHCNVTLSGSFTSSLVAITGEGAQLGGITNVSASGCEGGSVRAVLGVPWPIRLLVLNEENPRYAVAASLRSAFITIEGFAMRVLYSEGRECLISRGTLFAGVGIESLGRSEYLWTRLTMLSGPMISSCGFLGFIEGSLGAPSPRQVFTFLPGGEVINGLTPNPVEFGMLEAGGLAQRTVTIGSRAGGRIEEIVVTTGRYFAITDPNGCRGTVLSEHGTCTLNAIVSAPTETGRAVSDTLTVRMAERRYEVTLRAST